KENLETPCLFLVKVPDVLSGCFKKHGFNEEQTKEIATALNEYLNPW
ncbi:MAG: hypothetical protein ACD_58C00043G0001, partial [uncultured bacterium]